MTARKRRRRPARRRPKVRLRDRFFQAKVARAITSPAGIVAGSTVSGTLYAMGASPGLSFLAGMIAWGVPMVRAMGVVPKPSAKVMAAPKGKATSWDKAVDDAEDAVLRFQEALERAGDGPLQDRLDELEEDVLQSMDACIELAEWGAEVESARIELDPATLENVAKRAGKPALDAAKNQRQLVGELQKVEQEVRDRMSILNGRLDEAVGRAVEIIGRSNDQRRRDADAADRSDVEVDVAAELRSLSAALHEVDAHEHPHRRQEKSRRSEKAPPKGTTATG